MAKVARWRYLTVAEKRLPWALHAGAKGRGHFLDGTYEDLFDGLALGDRVQAIEAEALAEGYVLVEPVVLSPDHLGL